MAGFRMFDPLTDVGYPGTGGYGPQLIRATHPAVAGSEMIRHEIQRELEARADEWERLRPFVLKCPECSAPVESEQTTCKFCKVPLVWEPKESLTRDDHWMRLQARRTPERYVPRGAREAFLELTPMAIEPLATHTYEIFPQEATRLHALVVTTPSPQEAFRFRIMSVRIGCDEVLSGGAVSARAFSPGERQPKIFDGYPTVTPGIIIQVTVRNDSLVAREFAGHLECTTLSPDAPARLLMPGPPRMIVDLPASEEEEEEDPKP